VNADVFKRLFDAVPDDPDRQFAMAGATIVKVHRPGQGAKGRPKIRPWASQRAAGPPKSWRRPMLLGLWRGSSRRQVHRHDTVGVAPPIEDIEFAGLIASKACDSNWIIEDMNERNAKIVISQHPRRAKPPDIEMDVYKGRHLIENFSAKLKEFKRIALRSEKTDTSFAAIIHLASVVINSR
jgi:transposase